MADDLTVTDLGDHPSDACDAECTIRDAVDAANATPGADVITFADGLSGEITLTQGELRVEAGQLDIEGPGEQVVTISGDANTNDAPNLGDSRIFRAAPASKLSVSGLTLAEGYASGGSTKYEDQRGGAVLILPYADVTLADATITDSKAKYFGGGIENYGGRLDLQNVEITGNEAGIAGGAIHSHSFKYGGEPPAALAAGPGDGSSGAAAAPSFATLTTIADSNIEGNYAYGMAGGVWTSGAKYGSGGGPGSQVPNSHLGRLTVTGSTISGNATNGGGGGILSFYSDTSISDSEVSGNDAAGIGGALLGGSKIKIDDTKVSGNHSDGPSGGLSIGGYSRAVITDSLILRNTASYAGGMSFSSGGAKYDSAEPLGDSRIARTTIAGNRANGAAGGLSVSSTVPNSGITVTQSTISGNRASAGGTGSGQYSGGGGVAFEGQMAGHVELSDTTISGNRADFGAGVLVDDPYQPPAPATASASSASGRVAYGGTLSIENSTIAANHAVADGGGIYLGYYYGQYDPAGTPRESMTLPLSSTIVGDNTANGKRNDLAQIQEGVDDPGGFRLTNSLVEVPGNAEITQAPNGASVLGRDPQLGRLANNGGPTPTQLPEITSPAIDTGRSNGLVADQRRLRRTVDLNVPNGKGDGTDMGAVELQSGAISHTRRLEADEVPNGCDVAYDGPGERLAGDGTSQTIRGTSDPDILLGNGGDDRLLGLASGDCLAGGNGEDLVKGNRGADLILGRREADELFGGAGGDVIRSGTGDDRSSGGAGGDTISGGSGDDTLRGMAGDDVISVGSGADDVSCGPGDDTVRGVTRNDTIADNCEHIHRRSGSS